MPKIQGMHISRIRSNRSNRLVEAVPLPRATFPWQIFVWWGSGRVDFWARFIYDLCPPSSGGTVTLNSLDTSYTMSIASLGLMGRGRVRRRERVE